MASADADRLAVSDDGADADLFRVSSSPEEPGDGTSKSLPFAPPPQVTGAFSYHVVTVGRSGHERHHVLARDAPLREGDVVTLAGERWLIDRVDGADEPEGRVVAKPAQYRLVLCHPDGHEEVGDPRELDDQAPPLGHAFTTMVNHEEVSWQVVDWRPTRDDAGDPLLECIAERDFAESEALPAHELEHELAARTERAPAIPAVLERIERESRRVEIVALDVGEEADWEAATRFIDALVLEELEDDLIEMCGVDPDRDPRVDWLDAVKRRLRSDLQSFRHDLTGHRGRIEHWDFRDARLFASTGSWGDEGEPESPHGWMCRLVDSGALSAAGFERVRKAEL